MEDNTAKKIIDGVSILSGAITDLMKLRDNMNDQDKAVFDEQLKSVDVNKTLNDVAKLKVDLSGIQNKF